MKKLLAWLMVVLLLPLGALAEVTKLPIDFSPGMPYTAEFNRDVMVYEDPSIRVERFRVYNNETRFNCAYYYAKIKIADASQLRTVAVNGFENNKRTVVSVMARRVNAILAINGDFYGARPNSYVLRQGQVFREGVDPNLDMLLIDEDGDFHVILVDDDPVNADKTMINGKKVINAFAFGPALIINDEPVVNYKHAPSMSFPKSVSQRMVIAQTGHLEYLVLCCKETGLSTDEIIELLPELVDHVDVAYTLDGGESAQMVFLGHTVNKFDRECREVTDAIYFASAYTPD